MFKHNPLVFPKLVQVNDEQFGRYYQTPDGKFPSITNVLSSTNKNKATLERWRKSIGEESAQKIVNDAQIRGTSLHQLCEEYLKNQPLTLTSLDICSQLFENMKLLLDQIDNIRAQEVAVYSNFLGIAGTVDCCADYKGILSLIDFKSSTKAKKEEWIEDYFLQGAFYAMSIKELTQVRCLQIVILISPVNGKIQEFIIPELQIISYIRKVKQRVDLFNKMKTIPCEKE